MHGEQSQSHQLPLFRTLCSNDVLKNNTCLTHTVSDWNILAEVINNLNQKSTTCCGTSSNKNQSEHTERKRRGCNTD